MKWDSEIDFTDWYKMLGFSKYLQVVCVSNAVSSEYWMSSCGQNPDQTLAGPVFIVRV